MVSIKDRAGQSLETFGIYQKRLISLVSDLKKMREFSKKLKLENSIRLIDDVLDRVANKSFSVAVVGEFNRGKSTFINALLGIDILPMDILPTTATLNRITYGITPLAKVIFKDGQEKELAIEQLKNYITKLTPEAAENAANVQEAVVYYPLHYCQNNVDIIDTPGLNDEANMDEITLAVLPQVDAAIMVMMAQAPFADSERKFLETKLLTNDLSRIIFVVTGIDRCNNPEDADTAIEYIREEIQTLLTKRAKGQHDEDSPEYEVYRKKIGTPRVFGLSAYQALQAKRTDNHALLVQSRFSEFEAVLEKFLTLERGAILLQVPVNRAIASANEIIKTINLRGNALAMEQQEFEAAYNKSLADIKDLRDRNAEEMKLIDAAAEEVKQQVQPLVNSLESDLKHAATQVITSRYIDPEDLNDKDALSKRLGEEVSEAVQKAAQKLSEQIQSEIEHGLVKEVHRLEGFAKSVDLVLQHVEMQFLSVDAASQPKGNTAVEGVAAALAIYTGFGGIWSGYKEAGIKGAAVGALGSFGTAIAAGVIAALIGLPLTFPVLIAVSVLSYFTGGKLVKSIFGEEQVENFKANYQEAALKEIEKQMRENRLEQTVNQQIFETFDALKQKVHQEVELLLDHTQETLTNLQIEREREEVMSDHEHQELNEMRDVTQQILKDAQSLSQLLVQQVNLAEALTV